MASNEWLKSLKPGDEVLIESGYNGERIAVIDRVTPAGFVIIGKTTFRDGMAPRNGGFGRTRIEPLTPDARARIQRKELIDYVSHTLPRLADKLTLEQLAAIKSLTETVR